MAREGVVVPGGGVPMILTSMAAKTASKAAVNLASRSR